MNLKSTNNVDTNKYELEIEISATDFDAAVEKAYQKNKKKVSIPGFRPGKATRKLIEKTYGEGVFFEDAVNAIYPQAVAEAVEAEKLVLVDRPEVEVVSVSKEDGVVIKAICITKPEIEIDGYKNIVVEKTVDAVTEENINTEIDKLRQKGARVITIDDRAAAIGDDVVIDFEGFKDGVAFDGGKAENFTLSLGSGQFIPGFEDQVAGHSIGDEFDVNVSFPEEYQVPELAGAPVVFKIKLHEIKSRELPEVDDEFIKDTTEFETLEEYKADLTKKLEEANEKKADTEVENKLMDAVLDGMKAEIPQVMFDHRVDEMVQEFEQRLSSQGMNLEIYMQYTGMDMDSFRKTFAEQAEKQVKLRLALEKIVELENIIATDEDVEEEFKKIAEAYKMDVEKIKAYIPLENIQKDIAVGKAVDFVKGNAIIK